MAATSSTLGREFVHPREDQGQRETEQQQAEQQADAPGRDAERTEQQVAHLQQYPAGDAVQDGDPHDVTALEFGEKRHEPPSQP
jgi:hypothetical protein